jgi:hypothetical protein
VKLPKDPGFTSTDSQIDASLRDAQNKIGASPCSAIHLWPNRFVRYKRKWVSANQFRRMWFFSRAEMVFSVQISPRVPFNNANSTIFTTNSGRSSSHIAI